MEFSGYVPGDFRVLIEYYEIVRRDKSVDLNSIFGFNNTAYHFGSREIDEVFSVLCSVRRHLPT
jgi:hypothetical protein